MNERDDTLPRSLHASASWLGRVIGDRFELESLAGEGGMGTVYRARDRAAGGHVALKVVRAWDATTASRFDREAALLRELEHPGIVRYVANGAADAGVLYLAMEWLDGEDLADRLIRGALGVEGSVTLARQVASALGAAHVRGVVHRDIKPANIFLQDGDLARVKILDFGIARTGETARITTRSGGILGTLGYMAPEQARAAADIDAAADIFALGCVLFECLTGDPAFQGEHVMSILAKILFEDAPRLRDRGIAVSAELDALVMRMLDKDPKKRPRDGAALERELASLSMRDFESAVLPRAVTDSLTHDEQRLLSVIVTGRASTEDVRPIPDEPLRAIAAKFEARIERLLDGSIVTTITSRGSATDQAARAARCALALRELVCRVPMALATGLGEEGGAFPMGEVIDRAAALVRKNTDDDHERVRIDDVTAGLLDPRFDVARTGGVLFLRRESDAGTKTTRTLLGKPTTCVGRDRELALLASTYDACVSDSSPRVVLVTAASGVGKTRLRTELVARLSAREKPPQVWESRGDPMSVAAPWIMIAPILRRLAKIADGDSLETRRQRLVTYVEGRAPDRNPAKISAFLGEIVGAPFSEESSPALRAARGDAIVMGDQLRRSFADLIAAETKGAPLLLVLEDLHWGDLPSVALLDFALRTVRDRSWMILALARPEMRSVFPDLWAGRGVTHVELGALSDRASAGLVRDVMKDRGIEDAVVDRIVSRAAGNAFYLEELIRAVAEGRGDALPGTVLAMVQARLEALPPDTRRTLRAASVFGEVFWRSAVAKLLAESPDAPQLTAMLDDLAEKELISRSDVPSIAGKTEYFFRHAVVREAAYGALTGSDRILGHKLAGEWLEECGDPDAMLVAEHLERGAEPARAVAWYRRAAEEALAGNDFGGALARAQRGMECGAQGETRGALHLVRCDAHAWRSDHAASLAEASAAAEIFSNASEPWFKAVGRIALECRRLGRVDDVAAWAARLIASWPAEGASNAAIIAACLAADTLYLLGKPSIGGSLIDRIAARLDHETELDPSVLGHVHRVLGVRAHFRDRDPSAMATSLERSIAAFDEAGDTRNACVQRANRGFSLLPLGDYEEGERELRAAMEIAGRLGLLTLVSVCEHNLGTALGRLGRIDEALVSERAAVDAFARQKDVRLEAASRSHLAALELLAGSHEAAKREAERAVELAKSLAGTRAHALATLARIHLAMHEPELAMRAAGDARKLLIELGALEGSEELVRLVYAEALAATGNEEEARVAIGEARQHLMERANRISSPRWRETFLAIRECKRTLDLATRSAAP